MRIEENWTPDRTHEPTLFVGLLSVDKRQLISPVAIDPCEDCQGDDHSYLFHQQHESLDNVKIEGLARAMMSDRNFRATNSERSLASPAGSIDRGYLMRVARDEPRPDVVYRSKDDVEAFVQTSQDIQAHFLRLALQCMRG